MLRLVPVLMLLAACGPRKAGPAEPFTDVPCAPVYDPNVLQTFRITVAPEEWEALHDEYVNWKDRRDARLPIKPYHPVERFEHDGEVLTDVQIRLKGNPCCGWEGEKMQFVLAFNKEDSEARFQDLRKLTLDAPSYDPSLLRERLAYSFLRDAGKISSCANHARLVVNGRFYGVYTNIEHVDKEYLQRHFGETIGPSGIEADEGNLYKYAYRKRWFELETNEEEGDTSGLDLLYAANDVGTLSQRMDLDQVIDMWGAEVMVNQSDGYWAGSINYYLYDHPDRGFMLFPWDLDNAFDFWSGWRKPFNREDHHGVTFHFDTVVATPGLRGQFVDAIEEAWTRYDPDVLIDRLEAWDEQIRPSLEEEGFSDFTLDEHDDAVRSIRRSIRTRNRAIKMWL